MDAVETDTDPGYNQHDHRFSEIIKTRKSMTTANANIHKCTTGVTITDDIENYLMLLMDEFSTMLPRYKISNVSFRLDVYLLSSHYISHQRHCLYRIMQLYVLSTCTFSQWVSNKEFVISLWASGSQQSMTQSTTYLAIWSQVASDNTWLNITSSRYQNVHM